MTSLPSVCPEGWTRAVVGALLAGGHEADAKACAHSKQSVVQRCVCSNCVSLKTSTPAQMALQQRCSHTPDHDRPKRTRP